jgi:hypothetical protein
MDFEFKWKEKLGWKKKKEKLKKKHLNGGWKKKRRKNRKMENENR